MVAKFKMGRRPDLPDIRDYSYRSTFGEGGEEPFWQTKFPCLAQVNYPKTVDLRTKAGMWPPVFDQQDLGSCVENAWAAAMAYVLAKEGSDPLVLSRLFLYYNVRGGAPDDTGSTIRDGIKGVAKFGDCREDLWPYDLSEWQARPPTSAYEDALKRKGVKYARLKTLNDMIHCLANGYPFVFGISVYSSFWDITAANPVCPMPGYREQIQGGHALCATGYDRSKRRFTVRNSWGAAWGENGFFYLPFEYATNSDLASDFWTVRTVPIAKKPAAA